MKTITKFVGIAALAVFALTGCSAAEPVAAGAPVTVAQFSGSAGSLAGQPLVIDEGCVDVGSLDGWCDANSGTLLPAKFSGSAGSLSED